MLKLPIFFQTIIHVNYMVDARQEAKVLQSLFKVGYEEGRRILYNG